MGEKDKSMPLIRKATNIKDAHVVAIGNPLLEIPYHLTVLAQKMIYIAIAQIDDMRDGELPQIVFDKAKVYESLGISNHGDRSFRLRTALKELRKTIEIPGKYFPPDETGEYSESVVGTSWILKYRLWEYRNRVDIWIDPDLKPFLIQLNKQFKERGQLFTKQILGPLLAISKSAYTYKLFSLCNQYRFTKNKAKDGRWFIPPLSMSELRQRFGVDDLDGNKLVLEEWRDFRRRAIEPAIKEIDETTDFSVNWEASKKKGKKVLEIVFSCKLKKKNNMPTAVEGKVRAKEEEAKEVFDSMPWNIGK